MGKRIFYAFSNWRGGGVDVLADLAGALDDADNEVDPVLGEFVAVAPLGSE